MKAHLTECGMLSITPESSTEALSLELWLSASQSEGTVNPAVRLRFSRLRFSRLGILKVEKLAEVKELKEGKSLREQPT